MIDHDYELEKIYHPENFEPEYRQDRDEDVETDNRLNEYMLNEPYDTKYRSRRTGRTNI